ncbi:MAG: bifunctional phosphopantothenoylcysteine decarboxylase/phosphopantothenate--cysteine ligase CoaBC [Pseudomonadota bacterium]
MELATKKILLGLTGGIACYKAAELTRALVKAGAAVQVVMTTSATRFITPVTMQALSGKPVYADQWDARIDNNMPHIDLSRDVDMIVIAPCSANFMAKLAHGTCDDLLSTLCIARPMAIPLSIAPAMNVEMWQNPATQRNVAQLRADGTVVLGPDSGDQACGETGMGRMLEPLVLVEELIATFQPKHLAGKRVLITAGPTYEAIDPVRGLTNRSSGKMGYAIARAAREAGAEVTLVSGPTALAAPTGVQRIDVISAQQMHDAVMTRVHGQHVFIAVAAVADWTVANTSLQKIKKTADDALPALQLAANPDILAAVAALTDNPYCVGFAAESENLAQFATEKRLSKNIPLMVGNIGHLTFGQDRNELMLFDEHGVTHLPAAEKIALARALIANIAQRLPIT